jgi:AhpD family alkylhydroperoxidase
MEKRIDMKTLEPHAYKAMLGLESYLSTTSLQPLHKELIKIRASQINGCAYCINLHTKDARTLGEEERRIYALTAWREAPFYSEEERMLLAITEEVTLIQHGLSDSTYKSAIQLLGEQVVAQAIMAVIVINAWNRIGVATQMKPA